MRRYFLIGVAAAALAACGGAEQVAEDTTANVEQPAAPEVSAEETAALEAELSADQAFVDEAASSGAFAIATAQLAQQNAASEQVRAFAEEVSDERRRIALGLKKAAEATSPQLVANTSMSTEQETEVATLRGAAGDRVDSLFLEQQRAAQKETLARLDDYIETGSSATLKQWAEAAKPVIEENLTQMARLS